MWKVALILIFTIIAVPILTFYLDEPLNPLQSEVMYTLLWVYGIAALLCFLVSTLTDNYSQVDKVWSIIPAPYTWIVASYGDYEPRLVLMASLVTLWALRLTYNFWRRGGYSWRIWSGDEDYRWSILRARPGFEQNWKWVSFNFFFISAYQMGLILLMTLPTVKSMGSVQSLGWFDYLIAIVFVGLVVMEYIADNQQFKYQEEKYAEINSGEALDDYYKIGFTHTGLWGFMRHPNYMAEQGLWIVFYLFSVISTGHYINWSIAGALLLVLLFKGSSDFSEDISAKKYPDYLRYQKSVGRFLPFKGRFKK